MNVLRIGKLMRWHEKLVFQTFLIQPYPSRALDRRLQEDWVRDVGEDLRVLMSLKVNFGPIG